MKKQLLYIFCLFIACIQIACHEDDSNDGITEPELPIDEQWTYDPDTLRKIGGIVLLDLTKRNGEIENGTDNGRNVYSANHILEVAGMPFCTTDALAEAMTKANMMLFSSSVKSTTFTDEELDSLLNWVRAGGIIISPACIEPTGKITELFGIVSSSYNKLRFSICWDDEMMTAQELEYMDEPEEKVISLGKAEKGEGYTVKSYGYTLGNAKSLAKFDTGDVAVSLNELDKGKVYSFAILWRDVIQRPQLNKDFLAQRSYNNGFETSADAFPLFVRSTYVKHNPVSIWKSTMPNCYKSVLIPTHDCDSKTSYNEMHYMSEYEKSLGLSAHYFLTTHYYRDESYMSAYYDDEGIANAKQLLTDGHTIGSHSIGHFPDFNVTDNFPIVETTREEYTPHHDITTGVTTGGSTWAEIALSKQILETDLGNQVRSFRSGHLMVNNNFPIVEQEAGIEFSSCYSAGDVLSAYPFFDRIGNAWDGDLSTVLQMPLHISDVFNEDPISETNYVDKADIWSQVVNKMKGNYAPVVLLIHPNREWKMLAEKALVERIGDDDVKLFNFEEYGRFWRERRNVQFEYAYLEEKGKVMIRVNRDEVTANPYLCFMVEINSGKQPTEVVVIDEDSYALPMQIKKVTDNKYLVQW